MSRFSQQHVQKDGGRVCARSSALSLSHRHREHAGDRVRGLHQGQVLARDLQILSSARAPGLTAQKAENRQQRSSGGRGRRSRQLQL